MGRYYMTTGHRWLPITQEYFETILVDFFARPDGWWHEYLLFDDGKVKLLIKPKKARLDKR